MLNKHLKKAGGHICENVVEITIEMKTIVRQTLNDEMKKLKGINHCVVAVKEVTEIVTVLAIR